VHEHRAVGGLPYLAAIGFPSILHGRSSGKPILARR
jgi:hypothetical protein